MCLLSVLPSVVYIRVLCYLMLLNESCLLHYFSVTCVSYHDGVLNMTLCNFYIAY